MKTTLLGFTLIETILAMAIGMALMIGATFYLFNLTQAYVQLEEDPVFSDHVEGVCALLDTFIGTTRQTPQTKEIQEDSTSKDILASKSTNTKRKGKGDLRWEVPPGGGVGQDYVLAFMPQVISSFFERPEAPQLDFTGYLVFIPKKGLFLVYQTASDKKVNASKVNVYLLSDWVTDLTYAFYDEKLDRWLFKPEAPSQASDDKPELPIGIQLKFSDGSHEMERLVYLPI